MTIPEDLERLSRELNVPLDPTLPAEDQAHQLEEAANRTRDAIDRVKGDVEPDRTRFLGLF